MIESTRDGDIRVITLTDEKNVIHPEWQKRMLDALDEALADVDGQAGLVLTGTGKFFCNGLDVATVMSLEGDERAAFGVRMGQIIGRLVVAPIPTVAAINGHAFAAGAFLALACDYRIMRADRGWFCISEVDVGVPIGTPMMNLLKAKATPAVARDAVLTGHRYTAVEAIEAGLADGQAEIDDLLPAAKKRLGDLVGKERRIFSALKRTLFQDVAAGLGVGGDEKS